MGIGSGGGLGKPDKLPFSRGRVPVKLVAFEEFGEVGDLGKIDIAGCRNRKDCNVSEESKAATAVAITAAGGGSWPGDHDGYPLAALDRVSGVGGESAQHCGQCGNRCEMFHCEIG
jgi:hypothetical protein